MARIIEGYGQENKVANDAAWARRVRPRKREWEAGGEFDPPEYYANDIESLKGYVYG